MRTASLLSILLATACVTAPVPAADGGAMLAADAGFPGDSSMLALEDAAAPDDAEMAAADAAMPDDAGPAPCVFPAVVPSLHDDVPMLLDYASVGDADNARLLSNDCSYVLVVGDKRDMPGTHMRSPEVRARGGRSGWVVGDNGALIRGWLRDEGVAATEARLRARLASGYDYIVIDEVTADPEWADASEVGTRFRRLVDAMPPGSMIAYVSIDLTQYAGGGALLRDRQWLLRVLQRNGDRIALEVYLHTGQVMDGQAPAAFRTAADRLASAVDGMTDAALIQRSAFTVIGLSIATELAQYRYLDAPAHDLTALDREVSALSNVGAQRGLGYYFVNRSDITPAASASYDVDDVIDRMGEAARRRLE